MLNRLVAENAVKTPFRGDAFFSINKKMLAYSIEKAIKIKNFSKDTDMLELESPQNQSYRSFSLIQKRKWICTVTDGNLFEIFEINTKGENLFSLLISIENVLSFEQINEECLILEGVDKIYRVLPFKAVTKSEGKAHVIGINSLNSILEGKDQEIIPIISQNCRNIYMSINDQSTAKTNEKNRESSTSTFVYSKKKSEKYEKSLEIQYMQYPIAIYKDRYAIQLQPTEEKNPHSSAVISNIQIFDIEQSKLKGQVKTEGQFRFAKIIQNILVLIMNVENTDFYWFYVLNPSPNKEANFITHRSVYQKSKGDYYEFLNMATPDAQTFSDKKKEILSDQLPEDSEPISSQTSSVIYVMNRQKEKVEIIRVDHSKLLDSPFKEQKMDKVIKAVSISNKVEAQKAEENLEAERNRIKSTTDHTINKVPSEESKKKFVEALIDTKIKVMMRKFEQLEQRVEKIEKTLKGIYEKIDESMKSINRQEIKESVSQLFEQLTPQFEKYFNELFKQVSGVLDQGVSYYNKKLSAEADIHKQALSEIVTKTFESTEEIIKLSKKEERLSESTEKHLRNLAETRHEWQRKTEELNQRDKELSFKVKGPRESGDGKVFVKADLGSISKRET